MTLYLSSSSKSTDNSPLRHLRLITHYICKTNDIILKLWEHKLLTNMELNLSTCQYEISRTQEKPPQFRPRIYLIMLYLRHPQIEHNGNYPSLPVQGNQLQGYTISEHGGSISIFWQQPLKDFCSIKSPNLFWSYLSFICANDPCLRYL